MPRLKRPNETARSDYELLADAIMKPTTEGGPEPLRSFELARVEEFCRELDAALLPLARRWGLQYRRPGITGYKHGVAVDLFLRYPKAPEGL